MHTLPKLVVPIGLFIAEQFSELASDSGPADWLDIAL
jgi:hypothetical protein